MKDSKQYTLYVLGSRGSRPVHGRDFDIFGGQTSCFIVKSGTHAVIVDCGTGLFDAERILSDCEVIDIIFTHVHYDHMLGILDTSIFPKNARINLLGAFSTWLSYDTFKEFFKHPFWPIQPNLGPLCEISNDGTKYNLADGFVMSCHKSSHPDNGNVIMLEAGNHKICFMFDFEMDGNFDIRLLNGCDYLVFDGMFDDSEYKDHVGWGHSTYQEGCRIASACNVKQLLITHHSPKNNDDKLLAYEEKAKQRFANSRFCRAGDIFIIE